MKFVALVKRYPLIGLTLLVALAGWGFNSANLDLFEQITVSGYALLVAVKQGWRMVKSLVAGQVGLDVLAVTAILATIIVGEFWASLVIVLMLTGGEALEDYAEGRAERELSSLLEHVPHVAHRYRADGTTEDVAASRVVIGDRLLVRPSEIVPVDASLATAAASSQAHLFLARCC